MEQRRLRLGDIVDDYCPRERRVTNHAIVAMVEEDVKHTRCTTCDADHPYKGGRAPRGRKKDSAGALYKEVLAGINESDPGPVLAAPPPPPSLTPPADLVPALHVSGNGGSAAARADVGLEQPEDVAPADDVRVEDGPVHRQLIRATLPRLEGHKEVRQATDFTIRQPNGRGANFQNNHSSSDPRARSRGGQGQGQPSNRAGGGGARFAGPRPPHQARGTGSRPPAGGFRGGQPQRRGGSDQGAGGGRKRSR
jgi:hypothetical protein